MAEVMSQHGEWLSLIEVSGPFLAEPVLNDAFPAGLQKLESIKKKQFRQTYEEWRESVDSSDELQSELHQQWIDWVLKQGLEWDEDDEGEELKTGDQIPAGIQLDMPEHQLSIKPTYVLYGSNKDIPYLLVSHYSADTNLNDVLAGDGWSTSPAERMSHLCRNVGTRLGLVTNGEQWMFVDAPEGGVTSYASWYARLWSQEPITLIAFHELLNIRTVFNGFGLDAVKLTDLLDESIKHQDEVTETLGAQVQRAVEVLVQSLDRINNDSNGELLEGIEPPELYEAGLTFMMRLVFLLCAEERGLLLLDDETYTANYALSTLRMKLREEAGLHGEEVLSYRTNAWSRLLALFRAVYGGIDHESLRMPALGGSLFDPDRFPFLEGRQKGSSWKTEEARPLPIDNRTVLLFLDAIQLFQGRTLSYRALDVEQIGYVYEGLLERTVIRAKDVTLELDATQRSKKPWVLLSELASAELDGEVAIRKLLVERTGSSAPRVKKDLVKEVSDADSEILLLACLSDVSLRDRIKPYTHFLKKDAWSNPLIYPKGALMITTGTDRRETGTHYTPKSLTETIVHETLEPIVYVGPSEGIERGEWKLISASELLDLKICDPAMGSGAFLVQVCRFLSERLGEAWAVAEENGKSISCEGQVVDALSNQDRLPVNSEERHVIARRLVAERCLYGVDINPLAVELAKLSIWLMTLSKGRPFGFLDHNLKAGDSLLGIHNLDQLYYLTMHPEGIAAGGGAGKQLFSQGIETAIREALVLRGEIRNRSVRDIRDVEAMAYLNDQALSILEVPELIADALIGKVLVSATKPANLKSALTELSVKAGEILGSPGEVLSFKQQTAQLLATDVENEIPRKPIHWPLEFPEVFFEGSDGFSAVVGNPPFLGGKKISGLNGANYEKYLKRNFLENRKGAVNYVVYFFLNAVDIVSDNAAIGLISTDSIRENESREVGLKKLFSLCQPYRVRSSFPWPGHAGVQVAVLNLWSGDWKGFIELDGVRVDEINTLLQPGKELAIPAPIPANRGLCSDGVKAQGSGFVLTGAEAEDLIRKHPYLDAVIVAYVVGDDLNKCINQRGNRYIINFWDMPENEARKYPEAWQILEERVKPYRDSLTRQVHESCFWKFWDRRESFFDGVNAKDKFLVCSKLSKHLAFSFGNPGYMYSEKVKVFDLQSYSAFAVLQSSIHLVWHLTWGSSTGQTPAYVGSKVFDTFPFPHSMTSNNKVSGDCEIEGLSLVGEEYYRWRGQIGSEKGIGLTKIYNMFHDSACKDVQIQELRSKLIELDAAVLAEYGWQELELEHGFYDTEQGFRFGISDVCKSKLLTRLSELNTIVSTDADLEKISNRQKPDFNRTNLIGDLFDES